MFKPQQPRDRPKQRGDTGLRVCCCEGEQRGVKVLVFVLFSELLKFPLKSQVGGTMLYGGESGRFTIGQFVLESCKAFLTFVALSCLFSLFHFL